MALSYEQVLNSLKSGDYKPIYFFFGEEPYYIDQLTDYIAKNVLTEAEQSFNQTILYGKDSEASQVSDLARRFPMMASHQVVILKEAQEMKSFWDMLPYFMQPQPSTVLVINFKYKKVDKRKKAYKSLEKQAVCLETKKLYPNQVANWISSYASGHKYKIEPKSAAMLAEFLGSDLSKIANEIEKLIVAIGDPDKTITPALVEEHIGFSKDFNTFELQDALGKKDVVKANRIINYFAANEKKYPMVLTLSSLYYFFSKLLLLHYSQDKSKDNLARVLKVNPFFVKDYQQAARYYSAAKVVSIISLLRDFDMRSKGYNGTATSQKELTRELIFKILH